MNLKTKPAVPAGGMMNKVFIVLLVLVLGFSMIYGKTETEKDPYLWLEKVEAKKSLDWVKKINAETTSVLEKVPGFVELNKKLLDIYDSKARIPYATKIGKYFYNFWRDAVHQRGIYRRTTIDEYKKENPKWEIVLDVDALAKKEKKNWVYKGMDRLYPDYNLCLVKLSIGGADAAVVREFDISKKEFVKNGFYLPEAKSQISWIDKDTIFVGTDFGKGSLTKSGYPGIVKIWERGTSLKEAKTIYKAGEKSIWAYGGRSFSDDGNIDFILEGLTFYTSKKFIIKKGKLIELKLPLDSNFIGIFKKQIIIKLKSDYKSNGKVFKLGSVLIGSLKGLIENKINFKVLIEPSDRMSIGSVQTTKNYILVTILDNVVNKLLKYSYNSKGNWEKEEIIIKSNGTLSVFNTNEKSDDFFVNFTNFLTPSGLYMVSGKTGKKELLKSAPKWFDAVPYEVNQNIAVSKDGTKIPYFIIKNKKMKLDGNNPTLLYGYGGFLISMKPRYSATVGNAWLNKGGVYVLANIRGGGEFGPKWHQAALKKNRLKAYEDFIAIAEDLIKRKITSAKKLGIQGGSNGGLLVGATFVLRPDLFNAVVCQVPLLDMKRYTKLLAGASWAAEYGDPDKADMWDYIKKYSPYHNVKKGVKYPEVFFTTSTRDDRVHPAHARKMVAKMKDQKHKVYYYENIEGGHGGAANNKQRAYMSALGYAYLYKKLMGK